MGKRGRAKARQGQLEYLSDAEKESGEVIGLYDPEAPDGYRYIKMPLVDATVVGMSEYLGDAARQLYEAGFTGHAEHVANCSRAVNAYLRYAIEEAHPGFLEEVMERSSDVVEHELVEVSDRSNVRKELGASGLEIGDTPERVDEKELPSRPVMPQLKAPKGGWGITAPPPEIPEFSETNTDDLEPDLMGFTDGETQRRALADIDQQIAAQRALSNPKRGELPSRDGDDDRPHRPALGSG